MKKLLLVFMLITSVSFSQGVEVNVGADIVSKYVWRGIDFGNSPSIQPSLTIGTGNFEAGFWGSYSTNESARSSDELDFYMSYTFDFKTASLTALVTDYYFPNSGKKIGNFNNHDDKDGSGAHTLEAGLSLNFENIPLSISAYYNFYNDSGNNSYLQIDVPIEIKEYELNLFCGLTPGSEDNPFYYGTDEFSIVSVGLTATKSIKVTDSFELPVFVQYSLNPKLEKSYLVFGISL